MMFGAMVLLYLYGRYDEDREKENSLESDREHDEAAKEMEEGTAVRRDHATTESVCRGPEDRNGTAGAV